MRLEINLDALKDHNNDEIRDSERPARRGEKLQPNDHDFGGFYESCDGLPRL
jgi:hypothetical protein